MFWLWFKAAFGCRAGSGLVVSQAMVLSGCKAVCCDVWGLNNSNHVGALLIRIGFWGMVYHDSNQEPP